MTNRMRNVVRAALTGVAALGLGSVAQANQEPETTLDNALRDAARQSGREIIYPAEAVRGRSAPHIDPSKSPDDVIRALLQGTELRAEFREHVIVVRQRRPSSDEDAADAAPESPTVVVTASRIRGEPSSSPVVTTDRRAIELAGVSDLGEFARRIPQNFAGGQNPGVVGGGGQGGNTNINASSNFNLRGLGEDATLTLINGHRVAYDGLNQGIDISAFPIATVSRIEVVTDSASALHGSDAVGGVVNVILRSDYDGLLTSARVGTTLDGGFVQQDYSVVGGTAWDSGGVMLAADYARNSDILAAQRDYTSTLDPTGVLFPRRQQESLVGTAHQRFGAATISLDAQYSHRTARFANAFATSGGVSANGLIVRPTNDFYAVSPSVRLELPAGWTATVGGTRSRSKSDLLSRRFSRSLETTLSLRYHNGLNTGEASAEGPLLRLPGGEARLALGGGVRSLSLTVRNTTTTSGTTSLTANYRGGRDIYFGYGELTMPLFGPDNRRPGLQRLNLDIAARFEHYRGVSGIVTPKVGLVYEPIGGISLKGTWGRSFKAPTLQQENQIRQNALLPSASFLTAPVGRTVLLLAGGGNPLTPERAESWNGTLELRPARGLTFSASYFDIRYRDRVTTPIPSTATALSDPRYAGLVTLNPTSAQLAAVVATLPTGIANQTGQPYSPSSVYAIVNDGLTNLASQRAKGVDLSLDYRATLAGQQHVGIAASVSYLESDQQLVPGQATTQRAGTIFDPPHWHGQLTTNWERRGATLAASFNYLGETVDDRFTPQGPVGSFATFDLNLRVRASGSRGILRGLEAGIGVLNVFDEKPRPIRTTVATEPPYGLYKWLRVRPQRQRDADESLVECSSSHSPALSPPSRRRPRPVRARRCCKIRHVQSAAPWRRAT